MEALNIRDGKPKGLPTLKTFEQELIKVECSFDSTICSDPVHYYDLSRFVQSDEVKIVVTEIENHFIGFSYAYSKPARTYHGYDAYAYLGFMYTKLVYFC